MKHILRKASDRGHINSGWLDSHHSFSFGHYYDADNISFGALKVLNDDRVAGSAGFNTHSHENMEIVSIPLVGDLEHTDSTGVRAVIKQNDVQIMSAGTGIKHSEKNFHKINTVNFLQLWITPGKLNIKPRYDQKTFKPEGRKNKFQTVVAPDDASAVWINQDAWCSLADFDKEFSATYNIKKEGNGVFIFLIEGAISVSGVELDKRDSMGIWMVNSIQILSKATARLLLIDVPMVG